MRLNEVIWKDYYVDKIEVKHGVLTDEVEEILFGKPHVRRAQKGHIKGEDLYTAMDEATQDDIWLYFLFVREQPRCRFRREIWLIPKKDIMTDKQKVIDPIPEEFASYEEAAEFWDTHDTTDYPDSFETVSVQTELKHRRFEVEIDADLMPVLSKQAQSRGVRVSRMVSEMLREKVSPAA